VRLCSGVRMQELHTAPPPSKSSGPYEILAIGRINLRPVVRMELGQERWLKQAVVKVRGPIVASDQGSCQGHHCSETIIIGKSQFQKYGCIPRTQPIDPLGGKQTVG
jgi:hypothetical protein